MSDYDAQYQATPDLFGADPAPLLRHLDPIEAGGRVLDVGVGQGRNALALSRKGYRVNGIDSSQVAIAAVRDAATREDLPIELWHGGLFDYQPEQASFDAVLCFGLLQILTRQDIALAVSRFQGWLKLGGLLLLTAWHVDDPAYARIATEHSAISKHSYDCGGRGIRTFLERGEILDVLDGFQILHHWEGMGPEHRHGDGPLGCHGEIEVAVRRL